MKDENKDRELRVKTNEACNAYNSGDRETAKDITLGVLNRFLDDPDMNVDDCDVLLALRNILENTEGFREVLAIIRKSAQLSGTSPVECGFPFFRALDNSDSSAVVTDFENADSSQKGCHIIIACIPKSGSTFMFNALRTVTGFKGPKLCLNYSNEENQLYPPFMAKYRQSNLIAQEHLRASPQNIALVQAYATQTVVLVRNIFDSLVSMRDMLLGSGFGSTTAFYTKDLPDMDAETQLDATIDKWAHWQLEFFASWVRVLTAGKVGGYLLTYEQLMGNKPGMIVETCQRAGIQISPEQAVQAVETVEGSSNLSRLNKGVSGRGEALMNQRQIDSIRSMTRYYPDVDFSPLGLS